MFSCLFFSFPSFFCFLHLLSLFSFFSVLLGLFLGLIEPFFSAFSPFLFFPRPGWASSFSLFSISLPFPSSLISYARLGLSFFSFFFFPSYLFFLFFFLSFSFLVAVECSSLSPLLIFFFLLSSLFFFLILVGLNLIDSVGLNLIGFGWPLSFFLGLVQPDLFRPHQ